MGNHTMSHSKIIYKAGSCGVYRTSSLCDYDTISGWVSFSYHQKQHFGIDDIPNIYVSISVKKSPQIQQFTYKTCNVWMGYDVNNIHIPNKVTHVLLFGNYKTVYFPRRMKYLRARTFAIPLRSWYNLKVCDIYCYSVDYIPCDAINNLLERNIHNAKQKKANLFDL